jgi:hypothetical protein
LFGSRAPSAVELDYPGYFHFSGREQGEKKLQRRKERGLVNNPPFSVGESFPHSVILLFVLSMATVVRTVESYVLLVSLVAVSLVFTKKKWSHNDQSFGDY